MPTNQSLWRLTNEVTRVKESRLASEEELELALQEHIEILSDRWLVIGRQVATKFNGYIDLLCLDDNSSVVILELKKDKTPRDVVAQAIDYASWVRSLTSSDIVSIYEEYDHKYLQTGQSLDAAYKNKFGYFPDEGSINASHQMVVVASCLDSSTERMVSYLSESNVPINVAFFQVFEENGVKFLSRAWMMDPFETADIAVSRPQNEPWNGEFYVAFGDPIQHSWDDARKYGFVSAGGGVWYSKKLAQLKAGDRIWVNIPQVGYVGVGRVTEPAQKASEVFFDLGSGSKTIYDLPHTGQYQELSIGNDDTAEYMVKVDWIHAVDEKDAVKEIGLFGNQNIVCRPTTEKWTRTVARLKELWNVS